MKNKFSQSSQQGVRNTFFFQFLVMPIGGIIITTILGLLIAPIGYWLTKLPVAGKGFEQICRVTSAQCTPKTLIHNSNTASSTVFVCGKSAEDILTTFAIVPGKGNIRVIQWVSDYFTKAGYDPQTRCTEVSSRFQSLYERGLLNYATVDRMNGENVICIALEENAPCIDDGLLFTLKSDAKPNEILLELFKDWHDPTRKVLEESERIYIDLRKHLQTTSVDAQSN